MAKQCFPIHKTTIFYSKDLCKIKYQKKIRNWTTFEMFCPHTSHTQMPGPQQCWQSYHTLIPCLLQREMFNTKNQKESFSPSVSQHHRLLNNNQFQLLCNRKPLWLKEERMERFVLLLHTVGAANNNGECQAL